jgi:hypothetical protein
MNARSDFAPAASVAAPTFALQAEYCGAWVTMDTPQDEAAAVQAMLQAAKDGFAVRVMEALPDGAERDVTPRVEAAARIWCDHMGRPAPRGLGREPYSGAAYTNRLRMRDYRSFDDKWISRDINHAVRDPGPNPRFHMARAKSLATMADDFAATVLPDESAEAEALTDADIRRWTASPYGPSHMTPAAVRGHGHTLIKCARWHLKDQGRAAQPTNALGDAIR